MRLNSQSTLQIQNRSFKETARTREKGANSKDSRRTTDFFWGSQDPRWRTLISLKTQWANPSSLWRFWDDPRTKTWKIHVPRNQPSASHGKQVDRQSPLRKLRPYEQRLRQPLRLHPTPPRPLPSHGSPRRLPKVRNALWNNRQPKRLRKSALHRFLWRK